MIDMHVLGHGQIKNGRDEQRELCPGGGGGGTVHTMGVTAAEAVHLVHAFTPRPTCLQMVMHPLQAMPDW
jgi:hypothetical protein